MKCELMLALEKLAGVEGRDHLAVRIVDRRLTGGSEEEERRNVTKITPGRRCLGSFAPLAFGGRAELESQRPLVRSVPAYEPLIWTRPPCTRTHLPSHMRCMSGPETGITCARFVVHDLASLARSRATFRHA